MSWKRITVPNHYFTSDTHYGHARVIEYSKRPFTNVDEMDEIMIERWNAVVRPGDLVYHLGDFAFTNAERAIAIARQLRGQKYLIFGNHDKRLRNDPKFLGNWIWAKDLTQIQIGDQRITLCHYAMRTWASAHHGAWQLYGHSHGTLAENPHAKSTDVGVDCWNFAPVSFDVLRERMATRHYEPIDHHDDA